METAFIELPLGITKIVGDENGISEISVLSEDAITAQLPECGFHQWKKSTIDSGSMSSCYWNTRVHRNNNHFF